MSNMTSNMIIPIACSTSYIIRATDIILIIENENFPL